MNYFNLLRELSVLKGNEKKTAAQIRALQEKKLRTLLKYAYEHSDYYRETFAAAGVTAETVNTLPLSAFPTTDKAALLKNFDKLITVSDLTQEELRRFDAEEQLGPEALQGKIPCGPLLRQHREAGVLPLR